MFRLQYFSQIYVNIRYYKTIIKNNTFVKIQIISINMIDKLLFENLTNINAYNQISEALKEAAALKDVEVSFRGAEWEVVYTAFQSMNGCDFKEEIEAKAIAILKTRNPGLF